LGCIGFCHVHINESALPTSWVVWEEFSLELITH
jgi:hypothetical protein